MTIETLSQLFEFSTSKYNRPDLLNYRGKDGGFHKISSNEFRDRVIQLALGLKTIGVKQESKVLILSENRPSWHVVDFACHLLGAVVVPVFPTLVPEQIEYIVDHSGVEVLFASNQGQLDKILQIRNQLKKVKHIIVFDADAATKEIHSFDAILQAGRDQDETGFYEAALKLASPDDLATLIYTSGTTGQPKGVMLTHKNFMANVLDCAEALRLTSEDKALSFLPLSHAFERTVDYVYFYRGLSIAYSAGIDTLMDDLREAQPTIMANVPRFYEKVKSRIMAQAAEDGGLKKTIFDWAAVVGKDKADRDLDGRNGGLLLDLRYNIADRLVFRKIRARTGGRLRYFISGGAPLSAEVGRFFWAAGLTILEGYGLTETAPVISVNPYDRPKYGTVGKVLKSVEVKLAEDGEIMARGPNVMVGYYKMPEETQLVLEDGWFHTGDIGHFDDDGYLCITDRLKQLIVTSVGKKVAPQPVEKEVENSKYIEQALLVGEKRQFISALIVPDFDQLEQFAAERQLHYSGHEELVRLKPVNDLIHDEIERLQRKFSDYEKIRKFKLLPKPFTIESGELTPTMKIRRKVVIDEYSDMVEAMYESDGPHESS